MSTFYDVTICLQEILDIAAYVPTRDIPVG